jgi:hypothetical protein
MKVHFTPANVELFHKGQRVASHLRAGDHGHTVTIAEHVHAPIRRIGSGLIGNVSARKCRGEAGVLIAEIFSIRRLEGNRWRLRQMRSAIGFECHFGANSTQKPEGHGSNRW